MDPVRRFGIVARIISSTPSFIFLQEASLHGSSIRINGKYIGLTFPGANVSSFVNPDLALTQFFVD